nr:MAG TPA: hypothetical protein [Caudoviricetes sp.]
MKGLAVAKHRLSLISQAMARLSSIGRAMLSAAKA